VAEGVEEKWGIEDGANPPHPSCLYLDEWIVPLFLSFLSIKRLPFGTLPSFMIIKTFAFQRNRRRRRRRRRRRLRGTLNSISQPSGLPALIDRQRENAREGWLKEREINNDNKHNIHLGGDANMQTYKHGTNHCSSVWWRAWKCCFSKRWVKGNYMLSDSKY